MGNGGNGGYDPGGTSSCNAAVVGSPGVIFTTVLPDPESLFAN